MHFPLIVNPRFHRPPSFTRHASCLAQQVRVSSTGCVLPRELPCLPVVPPIKQAHSSPAMSSQQTRASDIESKVFSRRIQTCRSTSGVLGGTHINPWCGTVWTAADNEVFPRAQDRDYVVKSAPDDVDYQTDLQKRVATSPNVRTVVDTVRRLELLIFPFLASDLLHFRSHPGLNTQQRKDILRQALCGLADLHDHDVLHNGE